MVVPRSSDYPAPLVEIRNGRLDLSNAYAVGIGRLRSSSLSATPMPNFRTTVDEAAELSRIVEDGVAAGMLFIDDGDARDVGTAHPQASVWDNGSDAIATLRHEMEVRRIGISNFGLHSITPGQPLSALEARLLPLYLHHRYQLIAAAKSLGGLHFTYAIRTANGPSPARFREIVPPARQREACRRYFRRSGRRCWRCHHRSLPSFLPLRPALKAGRQSISVARPIRPSTPSASLRLLPDLAFDALLAPARVERLVAFNAENPANPGLREVLDATIGATWRSKPSTSSYHRAIEQTTQSLLASRLIELAGQEASSTLVRSEVNAALREILSIIKLSARRDASSRLVREEIERFFNRPDAVRPSGAPSASSGR
jgi:hypothetical protein